MKVIGLTGTYGSGKSTVAKILADKGIKIIDADKIAHEVVEQGKAAYEEIKKEFGEGILRSNGELNRKKLGEIVFSDKESLKKLNEIVHPQVRKEELRLIEEYKDEKLVILDVPLLYENKMEEMTQGVIVVAVDEQVRKKRLMERDNVTEKEIEERISHQLPQSEKKKLADYLVDNSGSLHDTIKQVNEILKKIENEHYNKKGVLHQ